MAKFVRVCSVNDVPKNRGKAFVVEGKEIAIFNVNGKFFALDQICPHEGGPLAEGEINGAVVTCPWHDLHFDLKTGKTTGESWDTSYSTKSYIVKVDGEDVKVAV